jgi:hypothetical protein
VFPGFEELEIRTGGTTIRGRRRILALWSRSGAVGSWYEPLELRRLRAFFAADGGAAAR